AGAPLPAAQAKGGIVQQPTSPGVKPPPKSATVTPPAGATGQPAPVNQKGGLQPAGPRPSGQLPPIGGQAPGPRSVAAPPQKLDPGKAGPGTVKATPAAPPATAGQQRIERAKEDRAGVEQQLQQTRQRELERRRQEDAARQQARQPQQLQR